MPIVDSCARVVILLLETVRIALYRPNRHIDVYKGTGGESIYGEKFEDEAFKVEHTKPFLLSMVRFLPLLFIEFNVVKVL